MNEIPSLSRSVSEYVRLELPSDTQLFIVNENLEATVADRHTCVSGTHRLAIHQLIVNNGRVHRIQIFTSLPLEHRFRVLLLDWDIVPRSRAIMGYLMYERMAGVVQVSDFRMSIANGIIPNILREDTVYMLGIRFEGIKKLVKITSTMTDSSGIKYHDSILTQRIGTHVTFVSADRSNTLRPNAHPRRVYNNPTRVTELMQTASIQEENETSIDSSAIATSTNQTGVAELAQTPTLALARVIRPFVDRSNIPIAPVLPFRPNNDPDLFQNYPDPGPSTSTAPQNQRNAQPPGPPPAEEWDSDDERDTRDFR